MKAKPIFSSTILNYIQRFFLTVFQKIIKKTPLTEIQANNKQTFFITIFVQTNHQSESLFQKQFKFFPLKFNLI